MGRFIVRFRGDSHAGGVTERLRASPSVRIVEETPRMLLLEADEAALRDLVDDAPGVAVIAERHYERPDPPLTVRKP